MTGGRRGKKYLINIERKTLGRDKDKH